MYLKYLAYLCAFLLISLPVIAQEKQDTIDWDGTEQNVFINLYSSSNDIQAGEEIEIVIEQVLRPHWHTYWKNPGDSGEPMKATWSLPEGFTTSEISWPTPIGLPFDPLLNYGFEGEPKMIQTITAPDPLPIGLISIPVRFDILVCKEICIPESVEKILTLNGGYSEHYAATPEFIQKVKSAFPIVKDKHGWTTELSEENDYLYLDITTDLSQEQLEQNNIEFFSYEYGLIRYPDAPEITLADSRIILKKPRGDFKLDRIDNLGGVLVLEDKASGERTGYELSDPTRVADIPPEAQKKTEAQFPEDVATNEETVEFQTVVSDETVTSLPTALLFAVIGGLILNLMPCVFPVLSMKALSLSKISEKSRTEAQKHGLAYTAGIIISFIVIAGLLIVLKTGGNEIGWGFHLQNPVVILLLAYLFFLIGLNLSGFFEIGTKLMSVGQRYKTEGVIGSFVTGILATLVATPCTAPFMAGAIGYAFLQPTFATLLIFTALGFGLALPYLLISFIPAFQKAMPRPGLWMVTFKEFLAFPMYATVIWLLWILSNQVGMNGIAIPLIGLLGIAFAIWLYQRAKLSTGVKAVFLSILAMGVIGGSVFYTLYEIQTVEMAKDKPMPEFGQTYSPDALDAALKTDQPVFVEMTAAWCVTCKVNHYRAIDIEQTREIIEYRNVIYMIGDWTNYDAEITQYLNKFGRNGVPIYIYYGRPDETGKRPAPEMLPQILNPSIVAEALDR